MTEPTLTAVICSLNGADGVKRCIDALRVQTRPDIEIVVVDDGSTDGTAHVAETAGAHVVRHATNKGLAAARNSGVAIARGDVVAFLDDDCVPDPTWAERLIAGYADTRVLGIGGPVVPLFADSGPLAGYLSRHNPLEPLELDLADGDGLFYRLWLYLRRTWTDKRPEGERQLYSLVGANMSFRRSALEALEGFDERFTFGAEELDLCRRVHLLFDGGELRFVPDARVGHVFHTSLRDTLRRSRAYGRGSARFARKWTQARPTIFPFPLLIGTAVVVAALRRPRALVAAGLLPQLLWPDGARNALRTRSLGPLSDPYVSCLQESAGNAGFLLGWREFRDLEPDVYDGTRGARAGAHEVTRQRAEDVVEVAR